MYHGQYQGQAHKTQRHRQDADAMFNNPFCRVGGRGGDGEKNQMPRGLNYGELFLGHLFGIADHAIGDAVTGGVKKSPQEKKRKYPHADRGDIHAPKPKNRQNQRSPMGNGRDGSRYKNR